MSKALAPTKYFQHPSYASSPKLVNDSIRAAVPSLNFGPFGSYDNALGRYQIETALGKKFFTLLCDLDPEVSRYLLDKNLP